MLEPTRLHDAPAPHDPPHGRPTGPSRRGLLALTALGLPATGAALAVGTAALPAHADPAVTGGETRIVDVPLAGTDQVDADGAGSGASDAGGADAAGVPARDLPEHTATMVGVRWEEGRGAPAVTVRGRLAGGGWTDWHALDPATDPSTGDEVPATEAGWLGPVTGVQIRAERDGEDVADELTAHLLTTSPLEADAEVGSDSGPSASLGLEDQPMLRAAAVTNPATPPMPGAPAFVSRAAWGADESLVRSTSAADRLKAVVVHHTAGSNAYSAQDSPQLIRGMLSYHTRTLGWADLGYNMLVDKYGQVFEGRGGGLHRNIVGAHARGYNTGSFGISLLGDYDVASVPSAAQDAITRLVAWKLLSTFTTSTHATGTWDVTTPDTNYPIGTHELKVVMGHRDVNATECPGRNLYGKLESIRDAAQRRIDGGWRKHLGAFSRAGGGEALGTVVRSAHITGDLEATVLTSGLVLSGRGAATATGWRSEVSRQWSASWGRPLGNPRREGGRTLQGFAAGQAVGSGEEAVFLKNRFRDVTGQHMYFPEIDALAARGITTGWPDGTYRPLSPIQRDAMVVFVHRALGSPASTPPAQSPFRDMSPSTMYYEEICWAHAEGIVEGWPDGTFRPTASVQRGAVAAFLYRASGSPSTGTTSGFRDVPANHQFAREITWLASTKITTGWSDGTFRPTLPIARDAMAAFMIRWMDHRGL